LRRCRAGDAGLRPGHDHARDRGRQPAAAVAPGAVRHRRQRSRAGAFRHDQPGRGALLRPAGRRRGQRHGAGPRPRADPAAHLGAVGRPIPASAGLARARLYGAGRRRRRRPCVGPDPGVLRARGAARPGSGRGRGDRGGLLALHPAAGREMRLFFVTGSLVHGGAERHAITLANRLAERGHDVHFAYVKNDPSQLPRLQIPATCLHAQQYLDFSSLKNLKEMIRKVRPTAVLATNPYALMYASLARPVAPLAVALHSTFTRTAKEWLQMAAYRPFFWRAERAMFVCKRQMSHWRRRALFSRSNEVIYNGVDLDYWQPRGASPLRSVLGFSKDDLVIGLSAVLRPEKNPVQLVEAVAMLRRRGIPARALLIGDGEMRPAVEAAARRLGIADGVSITGLVQDVRPFLAACDVLALTSHTEAFSLAAIEAMALGLPV